MKMEPTFFIQIKASFFCKNMKSYDQASFDKVIEKQEISDLV